jgi:hypothetical protein
MECEACGRIDEGFTPDGYCLHCDMPHPLTVAGLLRAIRKEWSEDQAEKRWVGPGRRPVNVEDHGNLFPQGRRV